MLQLLLQARVLRFQIAGGGRAGLPFLGKAANRRQASRRGAARPLVASTRASSKTLGTSRPGISTSALILP
ncbi:MAG: hypothetical protein OZSIB_2233 [Candidatus Ozemobacter sibiricus]|uniref:Uncharacterized protein n=1 Tax=Candidatus Ozemobacter sibiricus TaxID=2268124 RepID=A0A367ZT93_9BACT|nr:MAG: hypothetical protein OZSIB_2233 [Candidatus Ozemobacter sibiricus]